MHAKCQPPGQNGAETVSQLSLSDVLGSMLGNPNLRRHGGIHAIVSRETAKEMKTMPLSPYILTWAPVCCLCRLRRHKAVPTKPQSMRATTTAEAWCYYASPLRSRREMAITLRKESVARDPYHGGWISPSVWAGMENVLKLCPHHLFCSCMD